MQNDPAVRAIVEDTPLLVEKNLDAQCDVLVFVHASEETRKQRVLATRGWDATELARREKNQCSLDTKRSMADYVVDNDAGLEECREHVRRVLSQIFHRYC